jgi:hypothetical protein
MRKQLSRAEYIKELRAEYIIAEEFAWILEDITDMLPVNYRYVKFNLSENGVLDKGLPDDEFRKAVRAAVLRELIESLEFELNPPPRPRPRLVRVK